MVKKCFSCGKSNKIAVGLRDVLECRKDAPIQAGKVDIYKFTPCLGSCGKWVAK